MPKYAVVPTVHVSPTMVEADNYKLAEKQAQALVTHLNELLALHTKFKLNYKTAIIRRVGE